MPIVPRVAAFGIGYLHGAGIAAEYTGSDPTETAASAASDFEALAGLRQLAFAGPIDEPEQLKLWREEAA